MTDPQDRKAFYRLTKPERAEFLSRKMQEDEERRRAITRENEANAARNRELRAAGLLPEKPSLAGLSPFQRALVKSGKTVGEYRSMTPQKQREWRHRHNLWRCKWGKLHGPGGNKCTCRRRSGRKRKNR